MPRPTLAPPRPARVLSRKRLRVAVAVAAGLIVLPVVAFFVQQGRQAPGLLAMARQSVTEGDHPAAVLLYQRYLAMRPTDGEAAGEQAAEYEALSHAQPKLTANAIARYNDALAIDPARHADRLKLAKLYLAVRDYDAARAKLNELLAAAPDEYAADPKIHELLALCADRENKTELVRGHLQKAIDTGKAEPDVYGWLARTLRANETARSAADADAVMERLVTERPADLTAHIARARYLLQYGRAADARTEIDAAYAASNAATDPDLAVMYAELKVARFAETKAANELADARRALLAAFDAHPDHLLVVLWLAEVTARGGDAEEAKRWLREAGLRLPDGDPKLLDVADRLFELGDVPAAEGLAARLATTPAGEPLAGFVTARALLRRGEWPPALPRLEAAVPALEDKRQRYLLHKAWLDVAACRGFALDWTRQEEAYRAALKVDPASVAARNGHGEALLKLGRPADALKEFSILAPTLPFARLQAARLTLAEMRARPGGVPAGVEGNAVFAPSPDLPGMDAVRADVLLAQGRTADAVTLLTEAAEKRPAATTSVRLAGLLGRTDPAAGLKALDEGEKKVGKPSVETIAARGLLLASDPKADPAGIAALADAPQLTPYDRIRLAVELGDVLAAAGRPALARGLWLRAARELPFDLPVRVRLFDLAAEPKDDALRDRTLDEIRGLEGANGPVAAVGEVLRELRSTARADHAKLAALTDRLLAARKQRDAWPRVHTLLGEVAQLDGRTDDAVDHFRAAVDRGDRGEAVLRTTVQLLVERDRPAEAVALLDRLAKLGELSAGMHRQLALLTAATGDDPARTLRWVDSDDAKASPDYRDHLLRAQALFQAGRTEDALTAVMTALRKDAGRTAAEGYVTAVRIQQASGKFKPAEVKKFVDDAAAVLAKLEKEQPARFPDPAAVPLAVGRMRELLGDVPSAAGEYRKAMAANATDVRLPRHLYELFRRANATADAEKVLAETVQGGTPGVVRWARREQAAALADGPKGFRHWAEAVALLDKNLTDGGNAVEDVRAKAFLLARDPFQRKAAVEQIEKSAAALPLTADENFTLAGMYAAAGQAKKAEDRLRDAARGGIGVKPEHLAALARLQMGRGDIAAAAVTVDRLKAVAGGTGGAVLEEARLLAARGDQAKAAELLKAYPPTGPADAHARFVSRAMEEVGCFEAAEAVHRDALTKDKGPQAHVPLVEFLIRRERAGEAVALALEREANGCPAGVTARRLSAAVRSRLRDDIPADQHAAWDESVQKVEAWMTKAVAAHGSDAEVALAAAELEDARGRYPQAVAAYKRAEEVAPPEARGVIRNNLAALVAMLERDRGADEANRRRVDDAVADLGQLPSVLDTRALVHLSAGRSVEAVKDLEAAVAVQARAVYFFHLAEAHDRLKNADARDRAAAEAARLKLTRKQLHPLEWPEFERLVGKRK